MLRHEITPMLADTFALISMPQLLCILISSPQVVCRPYYTQTSTLTSGGPGFDCSVGTLHINLQLLGQRQGVRIY